MARILIIDDDRVLAEMLVEQMAASEHDAQSAYTLADGLELLQQISFDVVLLDVQLPDGNGLEYIPIITACASKPEVIIITGQGDADGAEKAVLSGAWSYIEKPYVIRELSLQLTRVLQYRREKQKVTTIPVSLKRDTIIGSSPAIRKCLDQIARASSSDVSVLVTGATGTGKELFARAIHENSSRAEKNFVVVDCAALPETLIESTLFGHLKGAFTNADSSQDGLVKHAHGGTLFLDEVGELPLSLQKTFLRLLQEHEYRPVGSTKQFHSDFRVVAATNRDLKKCVEKGTFRNDLLFRLQAFTIELPELKDRLEDVRELVLHFILKLCQRYGLEIKGIAADFTEALLAYHWPGNVRELYQTMEQVFTSPFLGPTCFAIHLPEIFRVQQARAGVKSKGSLTKEEAGSILPNWSVYKNKCELDYLHKLKHVAGGNVTEAAKVSELSRTRLYQLFQKHRVNFS
ncbi:MAG: sigma-54-dependent Fis family transcriptional regulator [Desulfobulbaceae bacterium]|nr:sigma-54-dependent Fis family transcriptional regulator [Desulfobulbaceae bacterium]